MSLLHAIIDYQNHLYSAKFVYTNKEYDTGTLYSQHMKCFKYAICRHTKSECNQEETKRWAVRVKTNFVSFYQSFVR